MNFTSSPLGGDTTKKKEEEIYEEEIDEDEIHEEEVDEDEEETLCGARRVAVKLKFVRLFVPTWLNYLLN